MESVRHLAGVRGAPRGARRHRRRRGRGPLLTPRSASANQAANVSALRSGSRSTTRRRSRSTRIVPYAGPAPSPVVHAQHAHGVTGDGAAGAHPLQQRRAADRHAHRGGVARAGIAAQRQADGPVHRAQPVGLTRPGLGDAGQRFGEGPARACGHRAPEPPNPDEQKRRSAEAGHVAEAAPVGAVDPPGRGVARGTGCRGHGRLRLQRHPAGIMIDLVEDLEGGREADRMQRGAQERYRIEGCFFLYGDPSRPLMPRVGLNPVKCSIQGHPHKTSKNP